MSFLLVMVMVIIMVPTHFFPKAADDATQEAKNGFDVDGSKGAAPNVLVCPNRQTTVTLSLPSAEYQNAIDIVFVTDSSSSTDLGTQFIQASTELFDSIVANNPNVILKIGVVLFTGSANDAVSYVSDGTYSGLTVYNNQTKDIFKKVFKISETLSKDEFRNTFGRGSGPHSGLDMADMWLKADSDVEDDHKYVVLFTDGKGYVWANDKHEATTIYAQYYTSNAYKLASGGKPTLSQVMGYNKMSYSVDVLDKAGKSNIFWFPTYEDLYNSTDPELTGVTKWDQPCLYAYGDTWEIGQPDGEISKHAITNGAELFGRGSSTYGYHEDYQYWYEFTPNEMWSEITYQEANPFEVIKNEDGTYTFDVNTVNPDYYQYHVDNLQKGLYKAGHLWTEMGKKYNQAVITYDSSTGGGLELVAPFKQWLRENSDYSASKSDATQVQALFNEIDNSIRYMVSRGVVADVIGEDFSLLNTTSVDCFTMTLNGKEIEEVTYANGVWSFGTPDENGVYPYVVKYADETKPARELITWIINVPVENAKPITLSYKLELREDAPTGFYDTNGWAILNYKSTDGTHDGSYVFDVPVVSYIACTKIDVQKIWDDSNNRYNTRPDSVTVVLKDGDGNEWTLVLNESGEWKGTFGHLPGEASDMHIPDSKLVEVEGERKLVPITYSLKELDVYGYESAVTGSASDGFTITNTRLTPDLTITKKVTDEADCARVFLFKVTGVNDFEQIVCIVGNGSVTLKDMLFGTYNVTELTDWSYDYDIDGEPTQEADLKTGDKVVTFANKADDTNWLRAETYADNWISPNQK
jgi:hypothetical protein